MELISAQQLLGIFDQFKGVERFLFNVGQDRLENDVEHSYTMAMMCWYFAVKLAQKGRPLDLSRVLKYALVHDLVEVYAGDTNAFKAESVATKKEREHQALERLQGETEFFPDLTGSIVEYELQADDEARFVKSVDKIVPVLMNLRDGGRSLKHFHPDFTFDEWVALKEETVKDPDIYELWSIAKEEVRKNSIFLK